LGPRSSIVAGLLVGIATAVVLLAGLVAFIPEPDVSIPSDPPPTILPSPTEAVGSASVAPTTEPTIAPPAASHAIALPAHLWIDGEGIVRDGSLGGIGPDIKAAGLQKIMPGVEVQF
jgi:hypothetical protein